MLSLYLHQRKDVKEAVQKETRGEREGEDATLKTCWEMFNPHQTWFSLPWAGRSWGRVCACACASSVCTSCSGLELHILQEILFSRRQEFVSRTRVCARATCRQSASPGGIAGTCRSNSSDGRGPRQPACENGWMQGASSAEAARNMTFSHILKGLTLERSWNPHSRFGLRGVAVSFQPNSHNCSWVNWAFPVRRYICVHDVATPLRQKLP